MTRGRDPLRFPVSVAPCLLEIPCRVTGSGSLLALVVRLPQNQCAQKPALPIRNVGFSSSPTRSDGSTGWHFHKHADRGNDALSHLVVRVDDLAKDMGWHRRDLLAYLQWIGNPLGDGSSAVPEPVVALVRTTRRSDLRRALADVHGITTPRPRDLVSTAEAARIARVQPATIRQWVRRGHLVAAESRDSSRSLSFDPDEVRDAMAITRRRRRHQSAPEYNEPELRRWGFDALVTTQQAAGYLGIPESTIRSWVRRGRLSPVGRRGRAMQFRLVDIYAMLRWRRGWLERLLRPDPYDDE